MNITFEQYQAAKKIVDDYEEYLRHEEELENDDHYDGGDWEEDQAEREEEEKYETALSCTCGAWVINERGNPIHVADCYCGAE